MSTQARNRAYALRSVWFEPGTAAYLGSLSTMRSQQLRRVSRQPAPFRHALAQPPLCRRHRRDRLAAGRHGSGPAQLGRPAAGRRRRPLRMAGLRRSRRSPAAESIRPRGSSPPPTKPICPPTSISEKTRVGYEWLENSRALRIREALGQDAAIPSPPRSPCRPTCSRAPRRGCNASCGRSSATRMRTSPPRAKCCSIGTTGSTPVPRRPRSRNCGSPNI